MAIPENQQNKELLRVAEIAALAGAEVLKKWVGKISVTEKNVGDYVTQADLESQETIERIIKKAFPDHDFLGEESVETQTSPGNVCWVVDPLDGTTNYIHQLHSFAVSIGVMLGDELLAACVYDPIIGEMFLAQKGNGGYAEW